MIQQAPQQTEPGPLLQRVLEHIVSDDGLHARWLNTLSMLENCGARKIARYEHPVEVTTIVLKHAAEEFRHAFSLKRQIGRVGDHSCPDYAHDQLLCPSRSRNYLNHLEVQISRHLKRERGLQGQQLRDLAYLLVTWAIEVRASDLYVVYQRILEGHDSRASMRSIIAEEEGHLQDMEEMLAAKLGEDWRAQVGFAQAMEQRLFGELLDALSTSTGTR